MPKVQKYLVTALTALSLSFAPFVHMQVTQAQAPPLQTNRIAMYSRPAVVRVVASCSGYFQTRAGKYYSYADGGQGSGFFINPDGYIATRGISKDKSDCQERLFKRLIADLESDGETTAEREGFSKESIKELVYQPIVLLPNEDKVYEAQVIQSNQPLGEGGDVSILKIEIENAPVLEIADPNVYEAQIREEVTSFGYPVTAAVPDITAEGSEDPSRKARAFFSDKSSYESVTIVGTISLPDRPMEGSNAKVLQLNMPIGGFGAAGSPVLNSEGKVIGMLTSTDIDKTFNLIKERSRLNELLKGQSPYPVAIPAKTILEYMRNNGIENKQAPLDENYRQGLKLYWDGDYEGAKEKFDAVKGAFPQHLTIDKLIQDCNERKITNETQTPVLFWGTVAAILASLLGLIAFLFWRNWRLSAPATQGQNNASNRKHTSANYNTSVNGANAEAWLEIEGQGEYRRLPLKGSTHRIGRDPSWSDLKDVPKSWEIFSRKQAILQKEGDTYRIFDGDGKTPSKNHLWIDQYTCVDHKQGYVLQPGDELKIGTNPSEQVSITYYSTAVRVTTAPTKMAEN
jgi:hypothetical protein